MHEVNQWRLAEYNALRAEILANLDYQKHIIVFGTTGVATIFGVMLTGHFPNSFYAIFLAQVVSSVFWYAWERLSYSTESIGTYIAVALERYPDGLNWELFQRTRLRGHKHSKTKLSRALHAGMLLPFVFSSTVCVVFIYQGFHVEARPGTLAPGVVQYSATLKFLSVMLFGLMVGFTVAMEWLAKRTQRLWKIANKRFDQSLEQRKKNWPMTEEKHES